MYGTDQLLLHSYNLHQLPAMGGGEISMSYIDQCTEFLSQDPQTSSVLGIGHGQHHTLTNILSFSSKKLMLASSIKPKRKGDEKETRKQEVPNKHKRNQKQNQTWGRRNKRENSKSKAFWWQSGLQKASNSGFRSPCNNHFEDSKGRIT